MWDWIGLIFGGFGATLLVGIIPYIIIYKLKKKREKYQPKSVIIPNSDEVEEYSGQKVIIAVARRELLKRITLMIIIVGVMVTLLFFGIYKSLTLMIVINLIVMILSLLVIVKK